MKEAQFIHLHEQRWQQMAAFLQNDASKKQLLADWHIAADLPILSVRDFPNAYRQLCEQLNYAENAGFSAALLDKLNHLALLGHQCLYQYQHRHQQRIAMFFLYQLPQTLRRFWRYFALSTALFCLPLLFAVALGLFKPEIAEYYAGEYGEMYRPDPDKRIGESRGAASDVLMFGHYVQHNTSIGLRSIAGAVFLGLGVFITLIFNGWFLGIVSAQMIHLGYAGQSFFPFVIGHAAFEITAIIFAGACGLALARALFLPQRQPRGEAVREMLEVFFPVLVAVVLLFFIAALIEAFWSAIWLAPALKYAVGSMAWFLVLAYFIWVGRSATA